MEERVVEAKQGVEMGVVWTQSVTANPVTNATGPARPHKVQASCDHCGKNIQDQDEAETACESDAQ